MLLDWRVDYSTQTLENGKPIKLRFGDHVFTIDAALVVRDNNRITVEQLTLFEDFDVAAAWLGVGCPRSAWLLAWSGEEIRDPL